MKTHVPSLRTFSAKTVAAMRRAFQEYCGLPVVSVSLRAKICLLITVLLVVTISAFYFITVQSMVNHVQYEIAKRAESLARNIAASAAYSFSSGDLLGLDNLVHQTKHTNSDVEYILIANSAMKAIVHSALAKSDTLVQPAEGTLLKSTGGGTILREVPHQGKTAFEVQTPIVFGGKRLGSVLMVLNKSALLQAEKGVRNTILAILATVLFLGLVGSFLLSSFVTKPIKELSSGVEELKQGGQSRPLRIYSRDELGQLTDSFNKMSALITDQQGR
ncbi:MAG TPA: HAMP domain-containing protein, partial [Dissulfurispiraceae bacterium]|nr:HAMP domain-containing protein [Dissulfurispiraceae bacterium]